MALAIVHALVVAAAWIDLSRRQNDLIRGGKPAWYVISALNTIGALSYFIWGRKSRK